MICWQSVAEYNPEALHGYGYAKRNEGNQGKKKLRDYINVLCAFDIETSRVPGTEQAGMYHWQMQIGLGTTTIHGRTWDELRDLLCGIVNTLHGRETLVIYVHNLSYEFQFLRGIYKFRPEDVFAVKSRKVLRAQMYDGKIELRCSYLLTNKSLAAWTSEMNVEHGKLDSGTFDHTQIRYPWSELSKLEQEYCRNDVLGLCEALQAQMERDGDTLATIPLTSTGYVRRDTKRAMRAWSRWAIIAMQPDETVYRLLHTAFAGGNTHANRYYAGEILPHVYSYDRSSSYPDVVVNCRYPMTKWSPWIERSERELRRLRKLGRALLFELTLRNVRLRDSLCGCPPISHSKCTYVGACSRDNGRILWASELKIVITDVDFIMIEDAYEWDELQIGQAYHAGYGMLPDPLRALVCEYYRRKTTLKGVDGQELFYALSKALINSIYGMMAQDPAKLDTIFDEDALADPLRELWERGAEDIPGKLEKNKFRTCLSYAWGVWVTAWARLRLWEGIRLADCEAGGYSFVYCDTDSIKTTRPHDLSAYNAQRMEDSLHNNAYADDPAGHRHYMGVFEYEGCTDRFVTLGAKKYASETEGKIKLTVAGVSKKAGATELARAGGLEAFAPGFTFVEAGGVEAVYNDETRETITIDGHPWELTPNVYLRPSTYTLGITAEYEELLNDPDLFEAVMHEFYTRPLPEEIGNE